MRATTEAALLELERSFGCLAETGCTAALVVRRGDELLLDLACGANDDGRPFTSTTPVFLYSAVKPVAALTVLLAVADGALGLDARVSELWPRSAPMARTLSRCNRRWRTGRRCLVGGSRSTSTPSPIVKPPRTCSQRPTVVVAG